MQFIELSFYDWLLKFKDVDLPIGDLEHDVEFDKDFPKESKDLEEIIHHLNLVGAQQAAIETAEQAFEYYRVSHLSN